MNIDVEKAAAKRNFDRLIANTPSRLSKREDRFAAQIERANASPQKKIKMLYSFMNELYEYVSKYTPCKKGCTGCCHYSVTVSEVEIAHIEKHSAVKRLKFKSLDVI